MKLSMWKLAAGEGMGQETSEQKKKLGLEYIAKLKSDGEKIIKVEEIDGYLKIYIEE